MIALRSKPEWVHQVCSRLDSFRGLPANWDSYGASPPIPASIDTAKVVLDEMGNVAGIAQPEVAISPDGNVALSWESDDGKRNLDVEVLGTGLIRFAYLNESDESAIEEREGTTSNVGEIANIHKPTDRDPGHCEIVGRSDQGCALAFPKAKSTKLAKETRILSDEEVATLNVNDRPVE